MVFFCMIEMEERMQPKPVVSILFLVWSLIEVVRWVPLLIICFLFKKKNYLLGFLFTTNFLSLFFIYHQLSVFVFYLPPTLDSQKRYSVNFGINFLAASFKLKIKFEISRRKFFNILIVVMIYHTWAVIDF